ncbi:MAG: hypothetical protein ACYTBS_02825 [Planctomycetota bacterium]|jgi:DNA-directed RNA polymerase subunit RPC12/RpoP
MLKFSCDNCGHKIGAKDEHAGKRARCPACGSVITVPEKTILVSFLCENCGEKISAVHTRAGKEGKCPKCRQTLVVPASHNLTLLDVAEQYKLQDRPTSRPSASEDIVEEQQNEESADEEDESAAGRKLPWLVDIFLYPTSASGMIHLAIFTIVPLLIAIVGTLPYSLGPGARYGFSRSFGLIGLIVTIAFALYLCWFLTECIRDSAKGGMRAPEAFATADLGEMWSQAQYIIGCYLIFAGPAGFYRLFTQRTDIVFWLLLAYGVLFLPMGLLACVMFDSIHGLNPVLLIASILSTIVQYCGLVLLIGGVIVILRVMTSVEIDQEQRSSIIGLLLNSVCYALSLYAAFIVSHVLGRFYWRYQDKLNWEV